MIKVLKNPKLATYFFQILTRSANPLGKLMDFLQEDVDSMQRELETWRTENKQLQAQLRYFILKNLTANIFESGPMPTP